jgi:hypothetical protein
MIAQEWMDERGGDEGYEIQVRDRIIHSLERTVDAQNEQIEHMRAELRAALMLLAEVSGNDR